MNKKNDTLRGFIAILCLIFLAVGIIYYTRPVWEVSNLDDSDFSERYSYSGCSVSVRTDGQGVSVVANDFNLHISQTIVIECNQDGLVTKNEYWRKYPENENGAGESHPLITEPDIFRDSYFRAARWLPLKARKAFLGYYNLECIK